MWKTLHHKESHHSFEKDFSKRLIHRWSVGDDEVHDMCACLSIHLDLFSSHRYANSPFTRALYLTINMFISNNVYRERWNMQTLLKQCTSITIHLYFGYPRWVIIQTALHTSVPRCTMPHYTTFTVALMIANTFNLSHFFEIQWAPLPFTIARLWRGRRNAAHRCMLRL